MNCVILYHFNHITALLRGANIKKHNGDIKMKMISVITVCYNAEEDIKKTINSVLIQTCSDFEYLVIDGASKDSTMNIVNHYQSAFQTKGITYHSVSQQDNGIFDAMNTGVFMAEGRFIIFLNAGDFFADQDVLKLVSENIDSKCDVIYGNYYAYHNNKRKLFVSKSPDVLPEGMICSHQAIFTKTDLLKERAYNTEYRMAADYDFYLKAYQDHKVFKKINVTIVYFDLVGLSQIKAKITQNEVIDIKYKYGYLSKKEKQKLQKNIWKICFYKKLVHWLPDIIRYHTYETFEINQIYP